MQYFLTITILNLILMHSKLGFEMIFHSIQSFRFLSRRLPLRVYKQGVVHDPLHHRLRIVGPVRIQLKSVTERSRALRSYRQLQQFNRAQNVPEKARKPGMSRHSMSCPVLDVNSAD